MAQTTEHCILNIAVLFHASVKAVFRENSFVLYIAAESLNLILYFLCHKHVFFFHLELLPCSQMPIRKKRAFGRRNNFQCM